MTTLDVTIRRTAAGATIDLTGDVDGGARATLDAAYAEAAPASGSELLLNFGEVGYINSTGIALIVGILARARAEHVRIGACGLSDHYRGIFEITRLSDFMAIYPDEASALVGEQRSEA
jgi:anti-anti-sigma factor